MAGDAIITPAIPDSKYVLTLIVHPLFADAKRRAKSLNAT